jgi:hypothetical protein
MFMAEDPSATEYDFTFHREVVQWSGDEEVPVEERYRTYEKKLNEYLSVVASASRCRMKPGTIQFYESGPSVSATVNCASPVATDIDNTSFTLAGKPIYRGCVAARKR